MTEVKYANEQLEPGCAIAHIQFCGENKYITCSDFGQSQFLEFGAVKSGRCLLTLRGILLPTSSGLRSKPSKEPTKKKALLLDLVFDPENGGITFLQKGRKTSQSSP
jgi:hypothetical protein